MAGQLERKTLTIQLAEQLEREIRSGSWGESLAGHRTLMARCGVSATTALAAIALLEQRRIVSAGEQGRRRRVLVSPSRHAKALNDLLIIDRVGLPSGEDSALHQAYRQAWEQSGGTVQTIQMDFVRCRQPSALLREAVRNHKADALLLHMPPLRWTSAAVELCPVFLSGGEWHGLPLTGVGYDATALVGTCVRRLQRLGHSRIAVPLDESGKRLTGAVRETLAAALSLTPSSPEIAALVPVSRDRTPGAWLRLWQTLFLRARPSAVIVSDDIHYFSLMSYCQMAGLHIPADVSVICLESTDPLEWCHPLPVRMRFPMKAALRLFRAWMRRGCRPAGMTFLQLEYCAGETLAPPAR